MKNQKMMAQAKMRSHSLVTDGIGTDILQGSAFGLGAMGVGLLGAWAVSCLVTGVIAAGGPLAFVGSWFSAVSGM